MSSAAGVDLESRRMGVPGRIARRRPRLRRRGNGADPHAARQAFFRHICARRRLARHARGPGRRSPRATSSVRYEQARSLEASTQLHALTEAGRAHLAAGHPAAALAATRRAAAMHRAIDFAPARHDQPGRAVVAPQPGAAGQRQGHAGGRGAGAGLATAARAHRQPERRRPAPQLPQQARGEPRDRPRVARACARAQAAAQAARGASRRQGQPERAVRAAGGHRPAAERDQERSRAARVPGRRGDRTLRRRACAAGAGSAGCATGLRRSPARCCPEARTSARCCESVTPWLLGDAPQSRGQPAPRARRRRRRSNSAATSSSR